MNWIPLIVKSLSVAISLFESAMGPFYAYLNDHSDGHCGNLITFANRETADEWWRMISTPPSPYAGIVKRISSQFYFQNDINYNNVTKFFSNARLPDAEKFRENVFITPLWNESGRIPTTIRPIKITDHISGGWYFLRSKADPWSHWYLRTKGKCLVCGDADCDAIHVSSEYRTKFCVRVRNSVNGPQIPKDFVMIGRDEISIVAPKGYILHASDDEDLKATKEYQGETDLLFEDLKNRFITRAEKQVNGEIWEYVESVERGLGEAWELID